MSHEPEAYGTPVEEREAARTMTPQQGFEEAQVPEYIRVIQELRTESQDVAIGGHFFTMMAKNLKLKWRTPVSTLLETLLPLIFVFGLVGIWSAVDEGSVPETHYVNVGLAETPITDYAASLPSLVCTHSARQPISGIRVCNATEEALSSLECYNNVRFDFPWSGLCSLTPGLNIVQRWLMFRGARFVPSLDEMIIMQMIANATVTYRMEDDSYQQPLSAIANGGQLLFAPDNAEVRALISSLNASSSLFRHVAQRPVYASADDAIAFAVSTAFADLAWGVVEVGSFNPVSGLDVTIHMNRSGVPWTNRVTRVGNGIGRFQSANYLASGFLTLQDVISRAYITDVLGGVAPPRTVHVPMGFLPYDTTSFLTIIGILSSLFLVFGYLFPVSQLVKRIVEEKEQRVREAMMIMGLSTAPFYSSWVVTYFLFQIITAILVAIVLKATMLPKSDFVIMFLLYLLFGFANVTMSGVISSFFNKSRIAALVSPVVFFIFAIPSFALPSDSPPGLLILLSLLGPTAFANGMNVLVEQEIGGGLTWANINNSFNGYPMSGVLVMLLLDTVLYLLLTLYLDAVLPSEWGTRSHPCFCFTAPCRWFSRRQKRDHAAAEGSDANGRDENGVFEAESPGLKPSVELRGLRKEFTQPDGTKSVAVNDLTLNMYENQVFALLGHNGAGKTTAMNLMTGMLELDGGDCLYHGKSVIHDLNAVRRTIGYCPQHNILWDDLTCREHLDFFARLKGVDADTRPRVVEAMLKAVDLEAKAAKYPHELSGGQKRKLSVGIAFVGGSRVVFLDEPTAGMDVAARRHTWELIKLMREGRTIVLTTHFMDEADLLGNTIAIMAKGRLKCSGSSVFLKSRLGAGYTLSIAGAHGAASNEAIINAVKSYVPSAEVLEDGAGEVSMRLGMQEVAAFPSLLAFLEQRGAEYGVRGHGISVTTLEEIFLKIAHDEEEAQAEAEALEMKAAAAKEKSTSSTTAITVMDDNANDDENKLIWNEELAHAEGTVGGQLSALLKKRFAYARRDTRTIIMQVVLPVVCITFAMLLTLIKFPQAPKFTFGDYSEYPGTADVVYANCPSDWSNFLPPIPSYDAVNITRAATLTHLLVEQANSHTETRIGAHLCLDSTVRPLRAETGANLTAATTSASVFFTNNSIYVHAGPQSLWELQSTWIRRTANNRQLRVLVATHPLPLSAFESAFIEAITTVFVAIFVLIPFTFVPSTFVSFVVKEREVRALQLQRASGLKSVVYWASNFIFDMISFVVTALLAIIVFAIFQREEYVGSGSVFAAVFVLMIFYGMAGVAGSYVSSFFFDSHSTAQNIVMLANFICGFMLVLLAYILSVIESTESAGKVLKYFFRIVPSYCLGEGILNLANRQLGETFGQSKGAFDMDVTGWPILYMALEIPIFIGIVLFVDGPLNCFSRRSGADEAQPDTTADGDQPAEPEDTDVAAERQEVQSGQRDGDHVVVKGLRKFYPSNGGVLAVKDLWFGVHKGEVFGFLGTNGAGKTTTISILCGDQNPTRGDAYINQHHVVRDAAITRSMIGYCPQFDALHDLLTVDEHLSLYSGLHGLTGDLSHTVRERLIRVCGLTEHRGKESRSLSGGNKRKLSVAISLLGAPQVVFLDEPSAGMDPMARRQMWAVIEQIATHCSVVLTTHHLEEIEALASRTGIMVDGELKCIGPLQHLKSKFGSGFEMSMRVQSEAFVDGAKAFLVQQLPAATLQEQRGTRLTVALPRETMLSSVFALIQQNKDNLGITDYSVSQTSLESVFLRISANAKNASDD